MLAMEACQSSEVMEALGYVAEWGKSTACTMRVTKPYHGTFRTVIGDSWFGSINTALGLRSLDMYFVGNVKTGHYACPKQYIKDRCLVRGDQCFVAKDFPVRPVRSQEATQKTCKVIVGGHCDKKPTVLVGTRGMSTQGKTMTRYYRAWVDGRVQTDKYTLDQPHMHELYRCNFNSVDIFNKLALGPNSLCNVVGTKIWWRRVWMGILGVCETNAYLAYCKSVE